MPVVRRVDVEQSASMRLWVKVSPAHTEDLPGVQSWTVQLLQFLLPVLVRVSVEQSLKVRDWVKRVPRQTAPV